MNNKVSYAYSLYKCSEEALNNKLIKLVEVVEILKCSEKEEFQKAYEIFKIFSSASDFDQKFRILLENGRDDFHLKKYYNLIVPVSKQLHIYHDKGYEEAARAIRKFENQLPEYEKAKSIVCAYIESSYNDDTLFLEDLGISAKDFEKFVARIKRMAPYLYKQYENKVLVNKQTKYNDIIVDFIEIANAIKNGKFSDGTEFNLLEFWKRIPFKTNVRCEYEKCREIDPKLPPCSLSFRSRVVTFVLHTLPMEQADFIINFLNDNNIHLTSKTLTALDLKIMFNGMKRYVKYTSNEKGERVPAIDVAFCDEDFQNMLEYISIRELPMTLEVFNAVYFEYVKGNITMESIKKLKETAKCLKKNK